MSEIKLRDQTDRSVHCTRSQCGARSGWLVQTIFRGLRVTPIQFAQMCWSPILSCRWQRRQQPQISPLCDMGRTQAGWFPVTVFRKKDSGFREKLEDICFARDL